MANLQLINKIIIKHKRRIALRAIRLFKTIKAFGVKPFSRKGLAGFGTES